MVERMDALVSFHYDRSGSFLSALRFRARLIGDSGAFSAFNSGSAIDIDAYGKWAQTFRKDLAWCAGLDVIGDPVASERNWSYLCAAYGVEFVPTVHVGSPLAWLDHYADRGVDFIGLGGGAGERGAMPWVVAAFRYARDRHPGMRFHGWAATSAVSLKALPWYSVDSTGTVAAARMYANARVFDPGKRDFTKVFFNATVHKHRSLLACYGLRPEQVDRCDASTKEAITRLMVDSTVRSARHLRARRPVSAPEWGLAPGDRPEGIRIHIVESSLGNAESVLAAYEAVA